MYLSPSPTAVCSGWCASRAVMLMYFLCWIMTSAELYQGDNLVRIGLIYSSNESTVWPAGWTSLPTAELALEKITESGILPGNVELEIVLINSGCNKANARNMVLDRVRDGDIDVFIGPPCTIESVDVVSFVGHPFFEGSGYQRPFLVATASGYNRAHDDETDLHRKLVPNLFEHQYIQIIGDRFNWTRLGIVYDSGLSGILEDVRNSADGFLVLSFFLDDSVDVKQLTEDLSIFKDKDVKIVRSLLQSNNHAKLICAAYRAGLMTSEYQWVIALWTWGFIEESLRDHCSDSEIESMISAMNGFLSVTTDPSSIPNVDSDVGLTSDQFYTEMRSRLENTGSEATSWDMFVYDLMWVIARNVGALLTSKTTDEKLPEFMSALDETGFYGISGFVGFEGYNPASPHLRLDQWIPYSESVKIAQYSKYYFSLINEIQWKTGSPPLDYTPKKEIKIVHKTETVNKIAALICNCGAGLGIVLCVVVMVVNFAYRKEKLIKITSPVINYFIITGSVMLMVCVISMSPTASTLDKDIFLACCYAYNVCLNLGFTMTFGALFAKTWRVYRAFSRRSAEKLTISDLQLVATTLVLVSVDGLLLGLTLVINPLSYDSKTTRVQIEVLDDINSVETTWTAYSCSVPTNVFYYGSAALKCLMLLFGGFLAFETRNVHVDAVNDRELI